MAWAIDLARDVHENGTYRDVHCWVFTPAGFCRMFERLASERLVQYRCDAFYNTEHYELDFTVIMSPCDDPADASRSWAKAARIAQDLPPRRSAMPTAPALNYAARQLRRATRVFARLKLSGI